MSNIEDRGYANADVLVSTDWVAENLGNPDIRIIESNEDPLLYPSGHIPGAIQVDWTLDLNDQVRRDYIDKAGFEALMSKIGATPETSVVFYGDKNNWWASYAFWVFQLFGHTNAKLMDGGRLKWEQEGRDLTRDVQDYDATTYTAQERDDNTVRALQSVVLDHQDAGNPLVDVRSPGEFSGELLHMANYPQEGALRGGHIPHAKNIPWSRAANPDNGTFKSAEALRAIYETEQGLKSSDDVITYCRIGERSSHSWFVLTYLLGYENVRNYDGSWTEWGNTVGVPIEK